MADLRLRVERIEARQRAYKQHDPSCPVYRYYTSAGYRMDPGMPCYAACDCWLSETETLKQ